MRCCDCEKLKTCQEPLTKAKRGERVSCSSQFSGYVPLPQCATQDNQGNHCPEKPTRDAIAITTGRPVRVCEKCFKSWSEQGFIKAHNS